MQNLFDMLERQSCFGCSQPGDYFCCSCRKGLTHSRTKLQDFLEVSVIGNQNPALMRAVSAWKDKHLKRLTPIFAHFLENEIPEFQNGNRFQIVTPPIRKEAYRKRGFHPISDLAKELCKRNSNLVYVETLLIFERNVRDQRTLKLEARKSNLQGAFSLSRPPDFPVILLDDVVTSGATFLEMYRSFPLFNRPKKAVALASSTNLSRIKNLNKFS